MPSLPVTAKRELYDKCIACRYLAQARFEQMSGQMPCLLGFWTEAFCASVYPDALLASFGKHRIIGQSAASARLTTVQPGRTFRMILPGLLFCKTA